YNGSYVYKYDSSGSISHRSKCDEYSACFSTGACDSSANERSGNKTFTPSTILPGENSRMQINLAAPTDTGLTNFSVTDHLPPNVTVSNSSPATLSPSCGASAALTATTGATSISLVNGNIPA